MADVQILNLKAASNHSDYVLPDAAEFTLKAVYAEFTDNGTTVNWMPAVLIISEANHTIAEAVDPGVLVTAGDDAEVSWFPGLKHAGAGAGAGAVDYLIMYGIAQNVTDPPIGDNDHAKFDAGTFQTNSAALWSFVLDAGGRIKEVHATAPGRYESVATFVWPPSGAAYQKTVNMDMFGAGPILMSSAWSTVSIDEEDASLEAFTNLPSGTLQTSIVFAQNTGGAVSVRAPYWWIKHWPV